MSKLKIRIDTQSEVIKFANLISNVKGKAILIGIDDNTAVQINAKSIIGALYAMTWSELWLETDIDIYEIIKDFVV